MSYTSLQVKSACCSFTRVSGSNICFQDMERWHSWMGRIRRSVTQFPCTCYVWRPMSHTCRWLHILAVLRLDLWTWEQLPTAFKTSQFLNVGPLVLGQQEPQLEGGHSDNPATSDVDTSDLSDETERSESASDASGDLPVPSAVVAEDTLPNTGDNARALLSHIRGLTFMTNSVGVLEEDVTMLNAVEEHLLCHQARDGDMFMQSVAHQPHKRPPDADQETHNAKWRHMNKAKKGESILEHPSLRISI